MPHIASGDVCMPHVRNLHPDVATFMLARAFAELYRDVLEEPVPEPLANILNMMKSQETDRGHPAA